MNGKKLFREYAKDKHGKEAKEFIKIEDGWYSHDLLKTRDLNGNLEECTIDYKDMVHWIIRKFPNII